MATTSRTMARAIDILNSFVIARPHVEIDRGTRPLLEIVANIADRRTLAQSQPIVQAYDPEIVRSGVTVALPFCICAECRIKMFQAAKIYCELNKCPL